jgi:hypothetical protein
MIDSLHKFEFEEVFPSWRPDKQLYCYNGGSGSSSNQSSGQSSSTNASTGGPTLSPQAILNLYGSALPSMATTATGAANTTASPALNAANQGAVAGVNAINLNGLSPGESNAIERSTNQGNMATGNLGLVNPTNTISNAMNFGGAFNSKIGLLNAATNTATGAANANTSNLSATGNLFNPVGAAASAPTFSSLAQASGTNFGSGGSSNMSAGICFLTTACCEHKGLPDDCEELTILRNFRDTFVPKDLIEEYYRIAPNICVKLQGDRDTLDKVYNAVRSCVEDIKANRKWSALIKYRNMVNALKN